MMIFRHFVSFLAHLLVWIILWRLDSFAALILYFFPFIHFDFSSSVFNMYILYRYIVIVAATAAGGGIVAKRNR